MDCEVKFLPEGKRITVPEGSTIMSAAIESGVDLSNICSGKGYCGKCLVEALGGELSPLTDQEKKRIPLET